MKHISTFLAYFCFFHITIGQVRDVNWKSERIAEGIIWKYHHFQSLNGSKQFVSVLEIDQNDKSLEVDLAFSDSTLYQTEILAESKGAIAAVNATYFNMKEGGSTKYLKVDDRVINKIRIEAGKDYAGQGALTIDPDKRVRILRRLY